MPLSPARERPRLWHHDYLHLRPLLVSLRERLALVAGSARVLDLGCGVSPYRALCPAAAHWVRVDLDPQVRPDVRTQEDFELEASREITSKNLEDELDRLEKELQAR